MVIGRAVPADIYIEDRLCNSYITDHRKNRQLGIFKCARLRVKQSISCLVFGLEFDLKILFPLEYILKISLS